MSGHRSLGLQSVSKRFGSGDSTVDAVKQVSFGASQGEFIALVGPSGSGKTTLLAMIGCLLTPTSGEIVLQGTDVAGLSGKERARYRRDHIGFVFQANNLLPFLTARENLLVARYIGGRGSSSASDRADQLLQELGMTNRQSALATELSGGERQRVAIGRALMNDPGLLLVDEPTASLDSVRGKQVVQSLIDEVKSRDKTCIMVTHDMAMADMADRILEMHDGALQTTTT